MAKITDETAMTVEGEVLRSAFVISNRFIVTTWHSIRENFKNGDALWFRLKQETSGNREDIYVPVRITNFDTPFDVAVLAIDSERLDEANFSSADAAELFAEIAIPLGVDVRVNDKALVMGFSEGSTSADSDTNSATVVDTRVPLGDITGLKLFGPALAAVSPVNPHGLSGGPVLRTSRASDELAYVAVGVIRAAPRGSIPGVAAGGGLVASRIEDVADRLPEIGMAISAIRQARPSPALLSLTREMNVAAAFAACGHSLRHSLIETNDPELGTLIGWPHFFNEPRAHRRPTAVGTAYGLKLSMILGEQCHGLDQSALAATLWKLRRPDGGWAARTGTGMSRPEISALVAGALASGGCRTSELAAAAGMLEDGLSSGLDPVAMERTYVVSAVTRGLIRVNPRSARLKELRAALLAGAVKDPAHGNLLCWSNRLAQGGNPDLAPSTPHTAQAIVALVRAGHLLGEDARSHTTLSQAIRWLVERRSLANQTEQIRRFVRENQPWDTLTVRHFTAAWVARALLLVSPADLPEADTLLTDAVRRVWLDYREGYWEWDDHDRPLWMAYQGAHVLREFALRTSAPL